MPFGVFEDHLIEGTLAEDLYEIDEWGATLGWAPDFYGLDISFSIYEDASIADNLNDFNTHEFRPDHHKEDRFGSYIANVTLEPVEETLTVSAFTAAIEAGLKAASDWVSAWPWLLRNPCKAKLR